MWEAISGKEDATYPDPESMDEIVEVLWAPNGKYIISRGLQKVVHVWDVGTGKILYTNNSYFPTVIAWSPDSKRIASGNADASVQIWDATTGEHPFTYHGHVKGVESVAWSPDGKYIASGDWDWAVQVWRPE